MFPLTSGWATILYILAAIGWAATLRAGRRWSRLLASLSPPMLLLFIAISVAPVLPFVIRPSGELIGTGNAFRRHFGGTAVESFMSSTHSRRATSKGMLRDATWQRRSCTFIDRG